MSENQNENNDNKQPITSVFDGIGEAVAQIGVEDIAKEIQRQALDVERRQANALEDINVTLGHIVKLLKPWAEREKRRNMIEQDPDYLEQVIRQVQQDRKTRKSNKSKGKLKRK